MIYRLSLQRFLLEVENHINHDDVKYVHWWVEDNKLHLHIPVSSNNVIYHYIHPTITDLPYSIKSLLDKKGAVLGVEDESTIIIEQQPEALALKLPIETKRG